MCEDYDEIEKTIIKNGKEIKLVFNDGIVKAYDLDSNNKLVSEFTFRFIEDDIGCTCLVTHMESYPPRNGLGTEIIIFVQEIINGYVTFSENTYGYKMEDGSHLSNEAQNFVNSLRKKGIIPDIENEFYEEEEL